MTTFEYVTYPVALLALSSFAIIFLRNKFFVPCVFLPSVVLTKMNSDLLLGLDQEKTLVQSQYRGFQNKMVLTEDGVQIDCSYWFNPNYTFSSVPSKDQRWLFWLNPNAAWFEQELRFLRKYAILLNANFISFNYRGTGHSQGSPKVFHDLVLDAKAIYEFLLQTQNASHENIILHGHSMGGAVAVALRAHYYPDGPLINDRSFSSFPDVANSLSTENPALLSLVGAIGGLWIGFSSSFIYYNLISPPENSYYDYFYAVAQSVPAPEGTYFSLSKLFSMSVMGALIGTYGSRLLPGLTNQLSQRLLHFIEWDVDVIPLWEKIKGPKLVIYHKLDGVISYEKASLRTALGNIPPTGTEYLELKHLEGAHNNPLDPTPKPDPERVKKNQYYHCYSLDTEVNEFEEIVQKAFTLFAFSE